MLPHWTCNLWGLLWAAEGSLLCAAPGASVVEGHTGGPAGHSWGGLLWTVCEEPSSSWLLGWQGTLPGAMVCSLAVQGLVGTRAQKRPTPPGQALSFFPWSPGLAELALLSTCCLPDTLHKHASLQRKPLCPSAAEDTEAQSHGAPGPMRETKGSRPRGRSASVTVW